MLIIYQPSRENTNFPCVTFLSKFFMQSLHNMFVLVTLWYISGRVTNLAIGFVGAGALPVLLRSLDQLSHSELLLQRSDRIYACMLHYHFSQTAHCTSFGIELLEKCNHKMLLLTLHLLLPERNGQQTAI